MRMRQPKHSGSSFEWTVRKKLQSAGLRFEVNVETLLGKPDIVFRREKIAVFLDGCFWHGCPDHGSSDFSESWKESRQLTRFRDKSITNELARAGWIVLRFWEHEDLTEIVDTIQLVKLQHTQR